MSAIGKSPDLLIVDEYADMPKPVSINLENLSQADLEAYQNDPEAFVAWLDTVMGGGPQFHPFSDPLSMIFSARPEMDYYPQKDNTGPIMEPKWHKNRSSIHGGGYYAQQEARQRKRLDKRANTKANRKRARRSRKG